MFTHDTKRLLSFAGGDFDRLAIDHARPALHHLRAIFLEQCGDTASEAGDDAVLPVHSASDLDARRFDADAERRVVRVIARLLELLGRMDQRLRWNAADVEARAAKLV